MILWQLFISYSRSDSSIRRLRHAVADPRTKVVQHQWITAAEFADIVAVSQITPGPIAINSATYVGYSVGVQTGHTWCGILGPRSPLRRLPAVTHADDPCGAFFYETQREPAGRRGHAGHAARGDRHDRRRGSAADFPPRRQQPRRPNFIDAWSWALFGGVFVGFVAQGQPLSSVLGGGILICHVF